MEAGKRRDDAQKSIDYSRGHEPLKWIVGSGGCAWCYGEVGDDLQGLWNFHVHNCRNSIQKGRRRTYLSTGHKLKVSEREAADGQK